MAKQKRRLRPWVPVAALFLIGMLMAGLVAVGVWAVSQADLSGGRDLELKTYSNFYGGTGEAPLYTVCVDAGHGGEDSGAVSYDTQRVEKTDNLTFALLLRQELREIGIGVVMTRTDDTTLSLEQRVNTAQANRCDLYICVHRNSGNGVTGGVEIWIDDDMTTWEMALGSNIMARLEQVGIQENLGVKGGSAGEEENVDYYVNSHTTMPSCLLELGYIDNVEDNSLFTRYQVQYAQATAQGIAATLDQMIQAGALEDRRDTTE